MRILQVHNRYRSGTPSGENRVVDQEGDGLRRHGHEVARFERSSDVIESWPAAKKALLPTQIVWSTDSYRSLRRLLRADRPDVVHVHNIYPLLSSSVLYACARERVPVVVTLHNYRAVCPAGTLFREGTRCSECVGRLPVPALRHGCYRESSLATLPFAVAAEVHRHAWQTQVSAFICLSDSQRRILAPAGFPPERVFVKHNLVPRIESPPPRSSTDNTIVFTGRLDETKGVALLMEAWDRYTSASSGGGLRLVIAGGGPLTDAVEQWARHRHDVEFTGLLSPEGCRDLMRTARAAVAPAQWLEPFGLVVVEAMAAGVALLAPAHGAFPELMVDGEEGRLFEPNSAGSLAELFREAERAPDVYARYGANARRAYESRFDPDDNIRQLASIYEFAISSPARTRDDATSHHGQAAPPAGPGLYVPSGAGVGTG